MAQLDVEALRKACRAVADNTVWDTQPFDAALITEHAENLFLLALKRLYMVDDEGRDPNILIRAVHYLAQAHAIPPMWTRTDWFEGSLDALLLLASPMNALREEALEFLTDVELGISEAREMSDRLPD